MSQKPSIGRVVHYTSYGTPGGEYKQECRAAIVTAISDEQPEQGTAVDLCVLNPTGLFFKQGVDPGEDEHRGGTWHWPERVDG